MDALPLIAQLANYEEGLVAAIVGSARGGSWMAAAWILERAFPQRWGRRDGTGPVPRDSFTRLDEVAERRRRQRHPPDAEEP